MAPLNRSDLKPGDTVTMAGTSTGPTGRYATRTPCCSRRVFIAATDAHYMERQPRFTVTRYCAGCGWPYEVHVVGLWALGALFTVKSPPRPTTKN
jgi:hypothetical protein